MGSVRSEVPGRDDMRNYFRLAEIGAGLEQGVVVFFLLGLPFVAPSVTTRFPHRLPHSAGTRASPRQNPAIGAAHSMRGIATFNDPYSAGSRRCRARGLVTLSDLDWSETSAPDPPICPNAGPPGGL